MANSCKRGHRGQRGDVFFPQEHTYYYKNQHARSKGSEGTLGKVEEQERGQRLHSISIKCVWFNLCLPSKPQKKA